MKNRSLFFWSLLALWWISPLQAEGAPPPPAEAQTRAALFQTAVQTALVKDGWKITLNEPNKLGATRPFHAQALFQPVLIKGYSVLAMVFQPKSAAGIGCSFVVQEHRYGYLVDKSGKTTKGWGLVPPDHGTLNDISDRIAEARGRFLRDHPEHGAH